MPDHKFEPGQLVLVRDHQDRWILKHFSHINEYGGYKYATTDSNTWRMCIPFNDETKHMQNTTQPYEPQKPPVEYEWGQKVEVRSGDYWLQGLYVGKANESYAHRILIATQVKASVHDERDIRPLPDTAKCGICGKAINERTAANDVECGTCCPEHYKDDTTAH